MRMRIIISFSCLLTSALIAPAVRADRRTMIRAYEYMTQPKDNLELEIWNEIEAPEAGGFDQATTVHRVELEYGITDHWDLALYHVFAQSPAPPPSSTPGPWRPGPRRSCKTPLPLTRR